MSSSATNLLRSDDTDAPTGVAAVPPGPRPALRLPPFSLRNVCHPRPVNAYPVPTPTRRREGPDQPDAPAQVRAGRLTFGEFAPPSSACSAGVSYTPFG